MALFVSKNRERIMPAEALINLFTICAMGQANRLIKESWSKSALKLQLKAFIEGFY